MAISNYNRKHKEVLQHPGEAFSEDEPLTLKRFASSLWEETKNIAKTWAVTIGILTVLCEGIIQYRHFENKVFFDNFLPMFKETIRAGYNMRDNPSKENKSLFIQREQRLELLLKENHYNKNDIPGILEKKGYFYVSVPCGDTLKDDCHYLRRIKKRIPVVGQRNQVVKCGLIVDKKDTLGFASEEYFPKNVERNKIKYIIKEQN